jgi:hypothetical protein
VFTGKTSQNMADSFDSRKIAKISRKGIATRLSICMFLAAEL